MPSLEPHGGKGLCVSLLEGEAREKLRDDATHLPSLVCTPRQLCDLELILNGAFSPLRGFMNKEDLKALLKICV